MKMLEPLLYFEGNYVLSENYIKVITGKDGDVTSGNVSHNEKTTFYCISCLGRCGKEC